jgi:hypothetical protein
MAIAQLQNTENSESIKGYLITVILTQCGLIFLPNIFLSIPCRALVFLNNNFNKKMPSIILNDEDKKLIALVNRELKQYIQLMDLIK